jgi:hypothetical protein
LRSPKLFIVFKAFSPALLPQRICAHRQTEIALRKRERWARNLQIQAHLVEFLVQQQGYFGQKLVPTCAYSRCRLDYATGAIMSQPAKLHVVPSGAPGTGSSYSGTQLSATRLMRLPRLPLPSSSQADSSDEAQMHAAAVARLVLESERLRNTEARLSTDLLAAVERETMEIAELNAKAEQRVQAIANARIEDSRILQTETNSRAIAEARARVVLQQRIAEERRLQQLAQMRATAEAAAARLAAQRADAEAAAVKQENERRDAEQNAVVLAQQRLASNSATAAVAEANLRLEREALESASARLAAEKREHDAHAKKVEHDQRAAQEALRRAKLEAELAVEAKRRADADTAASTSIAARIAAEHEAAELAQQQAAAEAALALASVARRDARQSQVESIVSRSPIIEARAGAGNLPEWAAGECVVAEVRHIPRSAHVDWEQTESEARRGRRTYLGWSMLAVATVAVILALALPQAFRNQRIEDSQGVNAATSATADLAGASQAESGLPGMKMSDRLSTLQ